MSESKPLSDVGPRAEPAVAPAPAAVPPKRRRWPRRLAIFLVALAVLVTFAPYALSLAPVRRWVAGRVSDSVGRPVAIGALTVRWWSGIEARDVEVGNPPGFAGEAPLLHVERVHADLAWWPLFSGRAKGAVDVVNPVANLLRRATGERNTDAPGGAGGEGATSEAASGGSAEDAVDLAVTVAGGRIVSREVGGAHPSAPDVVDSVEASLHVGGGGAARGRVTGVARGAAAAGGDARIEANADLDASGRGTFRARVPPLDLARIRNLAGSALGLDSLAGTVSIDADGSLGADGRVSGTVRADLTGVSARRGEETIECRRTLVVVEAAGAGDADRIRVDATLEEFQAVGFGAPGERLQEPRLHASGVVLRGKGGDWTFGAPDAPVRIEGRTVSGSLSGTLADRGSAATAGVSGDLTIVLSPTLGRWLGLTAAGEELRGTIEVRGSARGEGARWSADARVLVSDLRVPASWGDSGAPGRIDAHAVVTSEGSGGKAGALVVESATATGYGLDVKGRLRIGKGEAFLGIESGHVDATVDLPKARSFLERFAGLVPAANLAGRATAALDLSNADGGRNLSGRVDGDLRPLAVAARPLLGESFDDFEGAGPLAATFTAFLPERGGVAGLRTDASLTFARVASGGLAIENGTATCRRAGPGSPLAVTARGSVNGGTFLLDGSFDLDRTETPWRAKADVENADTAPILVGKGVSRFLPMLLPTILPSGAGTPVLSGLMTAHVDLASRALSGPALLDALTGPGSVVLAKGTVANSTLFAAFGGGSGPGSEAVTTLLSFAPAVGKRLRDVGRSLAFTDLASRFDLSSRRIDLHPVTLASPSIFVTFSGSVGFDGSTSLRIPVRLDGEAGKAVHEFLPDQTIPMKVSGTVDHPTVVPDLDVKGLAGKSLLDQLKRRLR